MTGEPNQQNQTSVFGFDEYPPPFQVNWNQTNPFANIIPQYNASMSQHQQMFVPEPGSPFSTAVNVSPIVTPVPVPNLALSTIVPTNNSFDQQLSGFSFGNRKPNQEVFQFENLAGFGSREIRCKRKTDSPPLRPVKQHITEEKMAEHMSKLHISSETAAPVETDSSRIRRLYMCEEMRKLQTDPILPQSLLSRIQSPCTALVLWKPPAKLVPISDSTVADQSKSKNSDSKKSDEPADEAEMSEVILSTMDLDTC